MSDLKISKKLQRLHKPCVLFACIHFLISFFTDRLIFTYSLCDFTSLVTAAKSLLAIGSKIAFFLILILLWQGGYYFVKKADRKFVCYTLIYMGIMCVLLLLTYPGIFRMDEFGLLFNAQVIFPVFWQNYLTSVFYIIALMLIPTPAGIILVQCAVISIIVGYLIYKVEDLKLVKGRWIYAVYLPFVLFPILDSNLYPMRMSIYAFLELCLLMKLVFLRLEKKKPEGAEFVTMVILSALVIVWRTEAIYYLIAIPVCFVCMLGKYTDKKMKTRFILWVFVATVILYIPQKLGDKVINGNQYELTGMLLPVVPLVDACAQEVKETTDDETKAELNELLDKVDKVLNVELMVEEYAKGKTGINMFWTMPDELQRKYTDAQFTDFKGVYTKLIAKYPLVFLKERVQTFFESENLLENTTIIFDDTGVPNHEQLSELFLAKPINKELRKTVISILELRDRKDYDNKLPGYSVVYHVMLPLIFLVVLFVVLCIKRKWCYAILLASHLCKVPLIFITAPSRLFMYYYPIYLTGVLIVALLILNRLSKRQMSNLIKTISFLKRNGIKNTCYTIKERLDHKNLEQIQVELKDYQGARYYASIERQEKEEKTRRFQSQAEFKERFLFSILVPAYETDKQFLIEMIDSVMRQTYSKVELILADASKSDSVKETVSEYEKETLSKLEQDAEGYPCIRYVRLKENAGISENTNAALEHARGDYIGLLDHDDVLTYDALYEMMVKLQEKPYGFLYSDEDKADSFMTRFDTPHIKPEINRQLLLSNNYICHFAVLRSDVIKKLRFRKEFDGAQDYDLFLRAFLLVGEENIAHVDKILYHWRCHESSTAANPESKRYAYEAGKRALEDFLSEKGIKACVNHSKHLGFYHIKYEKSLFQSWEDIGAICGKVIHKGRIIGGPVLEGRVLFKGLLENYSGYMHRAHFTLEVDEMDERAATFAPKYRKLFKEFEKEGKTLTFKEKEEYVKAQGDKLVYVP